MAPRGLGRAWPGSGMGGSPRGGAGAPGGGAAPPRRAATFRADIEGLRAVAVLSVLVEHFNPRLLPSGFLGVDIFFVISGYVITLSLLSRAERARLKGDSVRFSAFITAFYSRRFKRLTPALVVCVVATFVGLCLFCDDPKISFATGKRALFGFSNIYLAAKAEDYFGDTAAVNAYTQTWSLGVEEQFYVLYPIIFWVTGASGRRAPYLAVMGLLSAVSLAVFLDWNRRNEMSKAYFLTQARFWELAVGCLVAFFQERKTKTILGEAADKAVAAPDRKKRVKGFGPVADLSLVVITAIMALAPLTLITWSTVAAVCLTAVCIVTGEEGGAVYAVLSHRFMQLIGERSYSIYLWHWSVLVLSRWTVSVTAVSALFLVPLVLVLGWVSYEFVEKPSRGAVWSERDGKVVLMGLFLSATGVMSMCTTMLYHKELFQGNRNCRFSFNETCVPKSSMHRRIEPDIPGSTITNKNCFGNLRNTGFIANTAKVCTKRPPHGVQTTRRLYVYGDSFAAAQHLVVINAMHLHPDWQLYFVAGQSCPFDLSGNIFTGYPTKAAHCNKLNRDRAKLFRETFRPGDILYIAHRSMGRQEEWFQQLKELSKFAQDEAFHLVVQTKIPLFHAIQQSMSKEEIALCVTSRHFWFNSGALKDCSRPFWVPREASSSFSGKIKALADQYNTTWVFDVESLLCDSSGCSTHTKDNVRLYRDGESHLSKWGQLLLSPHFAALLDRLPDPPPLPATVAPKNKSGGGGSDKEKASKRGGAQKLVKGERTEVAPARAADPAAARVAAAAPQGASAAAAEPARAATKKPPSRTFSSS